MSARFVPYVIEAYRPFLVSHLIFTWPGDKEGYYDQESSDFFNLSYQAYDLSKKIFVEQSALIWAVLLGVIIILDIVIYIVKQTCKPDGSCPKMYSCLTNLHD